MKKNNAKPMLQAAHHVQITISPEQEAAAYTFYTEVMGLETLPKPSALAGRGGFWCVLGTLQIHVGIEKDLPENRGKAHIAYAVEDLSAWRAYLTAQSIEIIESIALPGMDRFECRDPFGNRMEFLSLQ
jgi:catechol 2,3-dioxygenase-like lactoylglutathione lyase family enzyme